jgi:hypothetical protein
MVASEVNPPMPQAVELYRFKNHANRGEMAETRRAEPPLAVIGGPFSHSWEGLGGTYIA